MYFVSSSKFDLNFWLYLRLRGLNIKNPHSKEIITILLQMLPFLLFGNALQLNHENKYLMQFYQKVWYLRAIRYQTKVLQTREEFLKLIGD